MTVKGKSHAAWNETIGRVQGIQINRRDAQTTSLTLNEFLESIFRTTKRKGDNTDAVLVGNKYGIDPDTFMNVKKSAEQYIIARSGQVIYGENAFDLSGWSTDISEDGLTLAVGSILNDGVSGLIGDNRGSVRVYSRSNVDDPWIQKGNDIDGEAAQDYSGWSVSLSADGDRVVIGAVFNDDGLNENIGHVRVYDWNSSSSQWGQVGDDIEGGAAGDFFGYSVSLSKNKNFLAIGAPYGGNTVGYVRVYHWNSTLSPPKWDQIDADQTGSEKGDLFGKHVALSDDGSRLVVSSPNAVQLRGLVHLYRVDSDLDSITLLTSKMGRDSGVRFGNSFDFKSNILAVSETGTNQPNITTYDTSSDSFDALQNNRITLNLQTDIHLKLSYDGNNLVFGMPGFNSEDLVLNSRSIPRKLTQKGHAEIYEREENKWVMRGWRMKGVSARDEFAKSVAISGNGEIVCLSVPRKDDGGTDRGCVSAYTVKPISHYVTPTITLTGLNPFPLQANTSYEEPGATTDTGASVTISGDIEDNSAEGQEYEILYTSQNGFGSVVTKTRRIIITKDPTIPTMTLNGDAIASIPLNGVFNDPGVTTSILSTVNIDDSNVDITRLGTYEIKYTAVSSYGIPSQQDMRRTLVVVYDTEHYGEPLVGRVTSMSRDGFILAVGDFTNNSVKLYEWDPVDQDWKRIGQEIEGPDDSSFGAAVDVSSDGLTVVIGAPQYSGTTSLSGLVRVYRYSFIVDQWEQVGDDIIDGQVGDNLGEFVTISGDGAVISCGTARPTGSKNPYVFTYRYGTMWTKFHTYTEPIKLGDSVDKKQFSGSLNFNGSRLLLGVPINNYTTGAVFLYDTENDEKLVSVVGEQVGDNIGQSVRLSGDGNRFVLGDVNGGCVKIYTEDKKTRVWNQLGNKISEGYGGTAVDLSYDGTTVTYSAMSTTNKGTVYQYRWDGTFWMPSLSKLTDSFNGNHFGRRIFVTNDASKIFVESNSEFQLFRWNVPRASLTFNGARIIRRQVDETYNYDYAVTSSNVVTEGVVNEAVTNDYLIKYIVTENGQSDVAYQLVSVSGELLQLGLNIQNLDDSSTPNNHGWSSSMSGDGMYFILGSPGYDNDRGMVKIYAFNPVTIKWDVMTSINGPNVGGRFGHSVSFSKNGSRVAIGAPDHGDGLVRVFRYADSTWSQLGSDLTGTTDGKFGWSVSLNNNGSRVTVGEPRKVFSPNTGAGGVHTYVYSDDWTSESSLSFTNNQIEHQLGYDVAISSSNDVVVFSAPTAGPGYVKISSYFGGNVPIFAQPITFGERFGWCLSISDDGNTFAAGAPFYDNKRGRVIVFDATTSPPTVKGSPIIGANVNDELGSSIHLIGNGTKIMIYTKEGRVTNYTYENSEWVIISSEVITSTDLTGNFGYSLSSSTDGSRMIITSPLSRERSGIAQVYSDETSQIQNSDFVPPVITLNGPALHRHLLNTTYNDLGVRRDDALPGFTTQGTVNVNVPGSYTLTYSAQDIAGNISNTVSRIVDVIDAGENNKLSSIDGPNSGQNNSTIQMVVIGNRARVAVGTGVLPEKYISSMRPIDKSVGVQGTVKVFSVDNTQFPSTTTQYGQTITDEERYFGTSINLSQDGTKLSVMSSLDSSSTKISVYGIDGNVYAPLPAPLLRSEASSTTDNIFNLPSRYYGFHDYAPSGTHIFGEPDVNTGRIGNFMRYKNNSLASSSDGRIVAIGTPSESDGTGGGVSVYKQGAGTTITKTLTSLQGAQLSPESGTFTTSCDFSEDGSKFIVSTDRVYIYRLDETGYVKETEFMDVDVGVNAISDNGSIAAYSGEAVLVGPPITLTGGDRISIGYGEIWNDPDASLPGVIIIGSVDSSVVGDHYILYETATQTKVRIVTVQKSTFTKTSSVVRSNVPYGPNYYGWSTVWRSRAFELFQADFSNPSGTDVEISIKLNGRIPVAGNWQYMSMNVITWRNGIYPTSGNEVDRSPSISFTSNGSGQGESYSWLGSTYTNKVRSKTAPSLGFSVGDRIYLELHIQNTFFSTFNAEVTLVFNPGSANTTVRIPVVSLTGFAENTIDVGENFTDPGFTSDSSNDTLTKVLNPKFPLLSVGRKAIVYQATSPEGINGYNVRYVTAEQVPGVKVVKYLGNAWNPLGNKIIAPNSIQSYTSGDMALSEDGTRIVFSKYIEGEGYVYTYEYSQLVYPPSWVQYGSTIELDDRSSDSPGFSLAMSGNGLRIVIGSPVTDATSSEQGEVYVYDYVDGNWQRRSENFAALTTTGFGAVSHSNLLYGNSVDISKDGTHIVVGSPPHVSVFELSSGSYILKGVPLTRGPTHTAFGTKVSISNDGNAIAVDTNSLVVYYNYTNNTWTEHGPGVITGTTNSGVSINGDGTKVLVIGTHVRIVTPETIETDLAWSQMGLTITPVEIQQAQPPADSSGPSPLPGDRTTPGAFTSDPPAAFMGLVVDLSHDGLTLAIGLPFLEMQRGTTFDITTRGAAIVFQWNDTTETWDRLGDYLIIPYYEYNNSLYKMYNGYEPDADLRSMASDNLNIEAEKTRYSGASISLSGDGQYLCVGSPGYVPNPIDQSPNMHALPNQAGLSSWTLFRRNANWAPTNSSGDFIHYSPGWEPVVTKYSDISESLKHTQKESDYDETKRELLGLGVKVSFDGSFVVYDTRTDGVKVLAIGEKEIINGMQLPSPNTFSRYDVHDKAFGAMVPQATSTSVTNGEYEMNGVVSIPDWSSTVNGQDHLDATLPTHPETSDGGISNPWRRVPILHPQSPLLGLGGITNPLSLDVTGSGAQLLITGTTPEDSLHYFAGENRDQNSSYVDGIMRGSTNFGFGEILSTSKDCKFMVTRRHLWGEFAAAGVGNWEGGSGTEGLKAKSHIKNLVDDPNFVTNGPEYKNFLTDFHSFSEVYVYYRDSPTADWVQRGSTNDLRALRYAELNKKYLVPTNHIYRCLFNRPTSAYMNNTETDVGNHCGLVLWMENFGTEAKISDDGMTLLISNFIGVPADYQLHVSGSRTTADAEKWESFMPLDEMNDFGNAIYYYKYNTSTNAWEPKPHKTLSADTYVETSFEMDYGDEFGPIDTRTSYGNPNKPVIYHYETPSGNAINELKNDYFDVHNVDHTQAPYPIFPSYFDNRMKSSDMLASGSVTPTGHISRKLKNLDYTSQFARSVSLSGNGDVVAVCEPNWNPVFDDNSFHLGYSFDHTKLYQRIHPDFCRSIFTGSLTSHATTEQDYGSEANYINGFRYMQPGLTRNQGGQMNYWSPIRLLSNDHSQKPYFQSSGLVTRGYREVIIPGDCGRVLFMKWNALEGIIDVDKSLPPFYSIQLLNYVEDDIRQKRYDINTASPTTDSAELRKGGFQYTIFKCELNFIGDEVTFFASYPSDFMERHGITDERVGIYTFKLTDAVDISTLTGTEVAELDPMSYYTTGNNYYGMEYQDGTSSPSHFPHGWNLGYTKYWKLKSKILTSQFISQVGANQFSQTLSVALNTQLHFKGDTNLTHSGPSFDTRKINMGTLEDDIWNYGGTSYISTPDPLRSYLPPSVGVHFDVDTSPNTFWLGSTGERREDNINEKVLSRRRYVNNWRSTNHITPTTPQDAIQNPLDLKVYEGTDIILFRDSRNIYVFKNGVNITKSIGRGRVEASYNYGTVLNAAYAPKAKTLVVSHYGDDGTDTGTFITMHKLNEDIENYDGTYGEFETLYPVNRDAYVNVAYNLDPTYTPSNPIFLTTVSTNTGLASYHATNDLLYESHFDRVPHFQNKKVATALSLEISENADTVLFSSGSNYFDGAHYSGGGTYATQAYSEPVAGLHEHTTVHTLTHSLTTQIRNEWVVQKKLGGDTTSFLTNRNIFTRSPEMADSTSYSSSYMNVPSVTNGFGAYPSKFWPVSYISLSKNNNYLTISEPVFDPLGLRLGNWDGSSTIEQNEDIRMGRVTAYRLDDSTRQYDKNTSMEADVDSIIEENSPITTRTSMNLYEPVSIAVSKDGFTIAIASVMARNVAPDDLYQSQKLFIDPNTNTFGHPLFGRMFRSWIQVYTYIDGQWTRKGNHISPGKNVIPDDSGDGIPYTNDELFLGQFMDLSGDGSRLITTGTSFHSTFGIAYGNPENSSFYVNSHEVYVYDFSGGVWVTTSGDVNNPERIFIRSKRQFRKLNPMFNTWESASTTSYNQGTFEDNYALGSIGGVSISEDGSRIAISTSNYSEVDYATNATNNYPTSRCVEMVLLLEYHPDFHPFTDTILYSQSYNHTNYPSGSIMSTWQAATLDTFTLPSNFTTRKFKITLTVSGDYVPPYSFNSSLSEGIQVRLMNSETSALLDYMDLGPQYVLPFEVQEVLTWYETWPPQTCGDRDQNSGQKVLSGTLERLIPNSFRYTNVTISKELSGLLYQPGDTIDLQMRTAQGYWSTVSVDFQYEFEIGDDVDPTTGLTSFDHSNPRGLNIFPYEINHQNTSNHWGADMFTPSTNMPIPGYTAHTTDARDFENVYVDNLAGGPVNWKLLHWEVFKAELDMAGSTSDSQPMDSLEPHSSLTRNKNENRYGIRIGIPHSIVSGVKFSGNDVLIIERYDNAVGMTNSSEDSKIDAHELLTTTSTSYGTRNYKSRRYNPNRYPQLLVFDSTMNQVTSRTAQVRTGSTSTPGYGVRWGGTWTVPDTRYTNERPINGENDDSHTRDHGWWINPITGWMLLDFERPIQGSSTGDPRPQGYQDVPFSVDVSDTTVNSNNHRQPGRVVFGIPQAADHRGKIQIFDISTTNHSQTINGTAHNTCRYILTQVGQDIYGDQVKGRFGENVSISGDGSRVAIGNRPFYLNDARGSHVDAGVDTKFYVYEYDSTNSEFTKTLSQSLTISKSLENEETTTVLAFQAYFYNRVEHNVYTQWGRPPCFLEQEDIEVGVEGTTLRFDTPSRIWVDSRYRESKVKLSSDGAFVVVSVFNDFMVYDIGARTTTPWVEFGQVITDTPQVSQTTDIDEFPYSGTTISQDGKTMVVPSSVVPNKFGNNSPGPWKKQFTLYDYNDDTSLWVKGTTNDVENTAFVFDGTGGGTGNDNFPNERTFLTILSSDKSRVSSLFGGATLHPSVTTAPTFRQHLPSGVQVALQWTKIRPDIHIASENLNEQQWKAANPNPNPNFPEPPSERIPAFAMSNDGTKIVVGNTNDNLNFSSVGDKRKSGSVSIFSYDAINARWDVQKVTVDDNSTELSTPYTPARFGHSLVLTRDGTRLVVSAPENRNGDGDIFVFDTSTTTATKDSTLQNPGGTTEFGYSLAVSDDNSRLFVGDPYHNSGAGRVLIKEYVSGTGFSGGTSITAGNSVETFAGKSFSQQIRFGESIDVSGDGNHLIASRFGKLTTPGSGGDVRDYYIAGGGIEIAEKWNRDTTTGVWELEANNRIKTGTDISTALYTPEWAVGDEDWYSTTSDGLYSRFNFFDDDAPKKPNVKISDSGEFYMIGMASLKEPGPLVTTNPRAGATSNVRHSSNVSVYKTFQDLTPIITLNGDNIVDVDQYDIYVDPGATSDVSTDVVVTTSNVNTNIIGNYVVRYETTRNGLTNFIDRTVRVKVVSVPPTVTLIGNATITLEQPTTYTEPDPPVTFSGGVLETYGDPPDGSAVGVFTIRYQVRNALGIATAERTVTILPDTTSPIVTILGGDITHKFNTTYRDPSYVGSDGNEEVTTTTPSYVRTITDVGQYRGTTQITYSAVDQAGNVGTETRNVDVKDVMEATALEQQLDNSYYSTISGDGSRIAIVRKVTNDVVLYDLPSTFVNGWSGFESMEGQMVKLSSDGQIIAFTASDGVRVYVWNETVYDWNERLARVSTSRFDQLGASAYRIEMSDDGNTISVSYPGGNDQYMEEVVVFRWDGTEYVEEHSIANGTDEATGLGTVMSLSSDGNRLALGIPSASSGGTTTTITSPTPYGLATLSPTREGVYYTYRHYKLTSFGQYGQNNTMYWQLTLGSRWTATWRWYIYGPRWGGADDMRLIYYATNPITAYQASVHNGYNNFYEFWQGDTHQIRDNNDIFKKSSRVYYGTSRWLDVEVSYDNGVMTSTVRDKTRLVSTLTHDFGTAHSNLYTELTYFGFSGRTGGVTSSQYISGINITSVAANLGQVEVYERSGGSWSQLGQTIEGGRSDQRLGSSVKLSGDGSTLVNVNDTNDANNQKVNVFSLSNGVWTKNPTLISNLKSRTLLGDSNDLVDISSDGTLLIYAEGRGTETYTSHPNGLSTKYIDGFKLENGQYIPVLLIQETSTTSSLSTNRVEVSNDGSKVLIQADDQVAVYNVTETVFNPVITLNYRDDLDTITVSGTYTEGGATSDVTDGSAVVIGGDTVTNTAGTYRVTYSVKDNNTGKSAHRTRTVIII
jgi:hypothetical protein